MAIEHITNKSLLVMTILVMSLLVMTITSNGHTKMGILQFFPLVLIAYFPRHNKRCYESEMNSHFHSIFCLTSEKDFCVSKSFPGGALLNPFPQDNVTLDQFLQLENCNAKTELTLHQIVFHSSISLRIFNWLSFD